MEGSTPPLNVTCSYESSKHGIPTVEGEMWGEGQCLEEHVDQYVASVINLLKYLGVIRGQPVETSTESRLNYIEGRWIIAGTGGFFVPKVEIRQTVRENQEIDMITDETGKTVEVVRTGDHGFIGAIRTFPVIKRGEWIVLINTSIR